MKTENVGQGLVVEYLGSVFQKNGGFERDTKHKIKRERTDGFGRQEEKI